MCFFLIAILAAFSIIMKIFYLCDVSVLVLCPSCVFLYLD